ncbi:MAG: hypothetical protein QXV22_04780, partial [Thermoplasmataceae archaeon]
RLLNGAASAYEGQAQAETAKSGFLPSMIVFLASKLYPDEFQFLKGYADEFENFIDPGVESFGREIQFYLFYMDFTKPILDSGLSMAIPDISEDGSLEFADSFDISLAHKFSSEKKEVVTNSLSLLSQERIMVLTGPNSGGKTTFTRMIGQLHALAMMGLPVAGTHCKLPLTDFVFTHFEREERSEEMRGKLEDDLVRLKSICDRATSSSLILINEMLSSTTRLDAIAVGGRAIEIIQRIGARCLYVTFIRDLAKLPGVISLIALADPEDSLRRTFRIVRGEPDRIPYASLIAPKYNLDRRSIMRRLET